MLSFLITIPAISLAIWYPHIGKLGALIAAFSTMFVIYILPLATFTKAVYQEQQQTGATFSSSLNSDDDFEKVRHSYQPTNDRKSFDINLVSDLQSGLEFKKVVLDSSTIEQLIDKKAEPQ